MRHLSIALVLALTALLALGNAVECEEETGISTTRVKKLYGKNYVGKLESTATIPSGGIPFLTKDGLLLKGPYIFDGMTGRLLKDISIEILYGNNFRFYYNGETNNYYILSNYSLYIYSLSKHEIVEWCSLDVSFSEYGDKYLLFADNDYIYYSWRKEGQDDVYHLVVRCKYKNGKFDYCLLTDINNDCEIGYQICYEPCFTVTGYDIKNNEYNWIVDWRADKPVITKLESEYYRAEYVSNGKVIAWKKDNDNDVAVCFSISDQHEVLWQVPKGYVHCERSNKYELLFYDKEDKSICVRIEDGKVMEERMIHDNTYGLSWLNGYVIIYSWSLNVQNLRTSEFLLPNIFGLEERLVFSNDNETMCAIVYDSIVVYSVKDRLEKYRVKYERISRDFDKLYWAGVLNKFIMVRDRDDEYYIYEISNTGIAQLMCEKDLGNICKEIINLCGVGRSRDVALNIINDKEWEGYVNISNQVIFVSDYKKRNINIISNGIIRTHVKYDDSFRVRDFIDEKYAIVYWEPKSDSYLYSFKTGNKCLIDYDCAYGKNIVMRDKDIYVFNTETRKYGYVRNLTNLKMKTMCADDLVFVEQVKEKCFLILRTEPCEPDEQARRITEFLENEEKQ